MYRFMRMLPRKAFPAGGDGTENGLVAPFGTNDGLGSDGGGLDNDEGSTDGSDAG